MIVASARDSKAERLMKVNNIIRITTHSLKMKRCILRVDDGRWMIRNG